MSEMTRRHLVARHLLSFIFRHLFPSRHLSSSACKLLSYRRPYGTCTMADGCGAIGSLQLRVGQQYPIRDENISIGLQPLLPGNMHHDFNTLGGLCLYECTE